MNANLKHKIIIQNLAETTLDDSKTLRIFSDVYSLWASVDEMSGVAYFAGQQIDNTITHKITIRYHKFVTSENWILFNHRRFRIRSVKNHEYRNRWLVLMCKETTLEGDTFQPSISHAGESLLRTY